jgi:hypothetical protein
MTNMAILGKNLPPPPAPIELTPEQKRLEEARKRLGKLSPELISDVRLLCEAAVDEVVSRSAGCGIPFESIRRDTVGRAGGCACSEFMMIADQVK